jgi:hypothetical protein
MKAPPRLVLDIYCTPFSPRIQERTEKKVKFQFVGLFDNSQCKIQNAKCRMIVSPAATIAIICAANTTILHFAFYILHSGNRPAKSQFEA